MLKPSAGAAGKLASLTVGLLGCCWATAGSPAQGRLPCRTSAAHGARGQSSFGGGGVGLAKAFKSAGADQRALSLCRSPPRYPEAPGAQVALHARAAQPGYRQATASPRLQGHRDRIRACGSSRFQRVTHVQPAGTWSSCSVSLAPSTEKASHHTHSKGKWLKGILIPWYTYRRVLS